MQEDADGPHATDLAMALHALEMCGQCLLCGVVALQLHYGVMSKTPSRDYACRYSHPWSELALNMSKLPSVAMHADIPILGLSSRLT